jgi:hypothetical protein
MSGCSGRRQQARWRWRRGNPRGTQQRDAITNRKRALQSARDGTIRLPQHAAARNATHKHRMVAWHGGISHYRQPKVDAGHMDCRSRGGWVRRVHSNRRDTVHLGRVVRNGAGDCKLPIGVHLSTNGHSDGKMQSPTPRVKRTRTEEFAQKTSATKPPLRHAIASIGQTTNRRTTTSGAVPTSRGGATQTTPV